ncbi:MAG: CvpA family protein [Leptothrix sp. (in: b-proteobacteria)]
MVAMDALGWIDLLLLGVLIASMVLGLWRGATYEVLSLLGWLVAWVVAQAWGGAVGANLHIGSEGSPLQHGAGFVVTFIGALLLWRVVTWLVQQLLQASPLAPVDRALGAGFGLLRGAVIVLLAVLLLSLTPLAKGAAWRESVGVHWSRVALTVLTPLLPPAWASALRL